MTLVLSADSIWLSPESGTPPYIKAPIMAIISLMKFQVFQRILNSDYKTP